MMLGEQGCPTLRRVGIGSRPPLGRSTPARHQGPQPSSSRQDQRMSSLPGCSTFPPSLPRDGPGPHVRIRRTRTGLNTGVRGSGVAGNRSPRRNRNRQRPATGPAGRALLCLHAPLGPRALDGVGEGVVQQRARGEELHARAAPAGQLAQVGVLDRVGHAAGAVLARPPRARGRYQQGIPIAHWVALDCLLRLLPEWVGLYQILCRRQESSRNLAPVCFLVAEFGKRGDFLRRNLSQASSRMTATYL